MKFPAINLIFQTLFTVPLFLSIFQPSGIWGVVPSPAGWVYRFYQWLLKHRYERTMYHMHLNETHLELNLNLNETHLELNETHHSRVQVVI